MRISRPEKFDARKEYRVGERAIYKGGRNKMRAMLTGVETNGQKMLCLCDFRRGLPND